MNRRQKHKYLVIAQRLHKDAKRFMVRYASKNVNCPILRKKPIINAITSCLGEWAVMVDKMMREARFNSLPPIDPSKYKVTENGNVLRSSSERPNK